MYAQATDTSTFADGFASTSALADWECACSCSNVAPAVWQPHLPTCLLCHESAIVLLLAPSTTTHCFTADQAPQAAAAPGVILQQQEVQHTYACACAGWQSLPLCVTHKASWAVSQRVSLTSAACFQRFQATDESLAGRSDVQVRHAVMSPDKTAEVPGTAGFKAFFTSDIPAAWSDLCSEH